VLAHGCRGHAPKLSIESNVPCPVPLAAWICLSIRGFARGAGMKRRPHHNVVAIMLVAKLAPGPSTRIVTSGACAECMDKPHF
jgi:hypothetical protein